ncbi:MAG: response regulator [Desulfobacteraceae bacterium]|nr:response regulator [Desulfobacteraceae bacterium]
MTEDDEAVRSFYRSVLQRSGYTAVEAADGEEAVKNTTECRDKIDLFLLDLIMPKMNGKKAFDAIRKTRPDAKVLFRERLRPGHHSAEGLH